MIPGLHLEISATHLLYLKPKKLLRGDKLKKQVHTANKVIAKCKKMYKYIYTCLQLCCTLILFGTKRLRFPSFLSKVTHKIVSQIIRSNTKTNYDYLSSQMLMSSPEVFQKTENSYCFELEVTAAKDIGRFKLLCNTDGFEKKNTIFPVCTVRSFRS